MNFWTVLAAIKRHKQRTKIQETQNQNTLNFNRLNRIGDKNQIDVKFWIEIATKINNIFFVGRYNIATLRHTRVLWFVIQTKQPNSVQFFVSCSVSIDQRKKNTNILSTKKFKSTETSLWINKPLLRSVKKVLQPPVTTESKCILKTFRASSFFLTNPISKKYRRCSGQFV